MTLLFVALGIYSRTGGMEAFNQRVVRCLGDFARQSGSAVRVLALWDEPAHAGQAPRGVLFRPACSSKIRMLLAFVRELYHGQVDLVLYGHVLLAPLALLAAVLRPQARGILFAHGTEVWGDPQFRRTPWWERILVAAVIRRVVCVSKFTMSRMMRAYGIPADRFALLPNAVDCLKTSQHYERQVHAGSPVLLTVCRLGFKDGYKGVGKVILAMKDIVQAVPDAVYWVVGSGPLQEHLKSLARSIGVGERVHFFGYCSERKLREIYRRAQAFIMPSTGEGFGIVFLEAWRYGLPVICGNVDASSEVVTDGVNGLTVDPNSVTAIARAAVRLLKDSSLCAELGARGRAAVMNNYTHKMFHQRLLSILRQESQCETMITNDYYQAS